LQWGNLDIFSPSVDLSWIIYQNGTEISFSRSTGGVDNTTSAHGGTLVANVWQAVCVDYDGTKVRVYINGVMVGSEVITLHLADCTKPLAIGGNSDNAFFFYNGYIDELRITKGIARYASDSGYTVSTTRFPRP
jgi:hypothetical protein